MSQQAYHILYFTPDLASGQRFAIGAFVRDAKERRFVAASHRPGPDCLGSTQRALLLEIVTERAHGLSDWTSPEVHRTLGQYVEVGPEIALAQRVPDLASWLVAQVLPSRPEVARTPALPKPSRDAAGLNYFATRKLSSLVQNRFRLESFWADERPSAVKTGITATHWVDGGDRILMLEPVLVRENLQITRNVHIHILALQQWMQRVSAAAGSQVGAYVLHGGSPESRRNACLLLRDATDLVFDVADPTQADELDTCIRSTAQLADLAAGAALQ